MKHIFRLLILLGDLVFNNIFIVGAVGFCLLAIIIAYTATNPKEYAVALMTLIGAGGSASLAYRLKHWEE